jgi:hypothetical protein
VEACSVGVFISSSRGRDRHAPSGDIGSERERGCCERVEAVAARRWL